MMEELLTSVSTSYRNHNEAVEDFLVEVPKQPQSSFRDVVNISSPENALKALHAQPTYETLSSALKYLVQDAPKTSGFNIAYPSPTVAKLVNVLVSEIVPSYWEILRDQHGSEKEKVVNTNPEKKLLILCLRSVAALNAIVARLKALIQEAKGGGIATRTSKSADHLQIYLGVLEAVLQGDDVVKNLWKNFSEEPVSTQRALWREMVVLLAGGKILNIAAESSSIINNSLKGIGRSIWIADGQSYSHWLASNIVKAAEPLRSTTETSWKPLTELLNKSLRLGYANVVIEDILSLVLGGNDKRTEFIGILKNCGPREQQTFLSRGLRILSRDFLSSSENFDDSEWWKQDSDVIAAAAGYVNFIIADDETRKSHLITWITNPTGAGVGDAVGIRRAVLSALSNSEHDIEDILEKSLQQFGDQLYIKHSSSIQQDVHCQVLLLAAGYVFRLAPIKLSRVMRSSSYLTAVSNRLAASSERARFLGMIVGEALSSLSDKPDTRMDFKMDELQSSEAKWYKTLTSVSDTAGSIDALRFSQLSVRKLKTHQSTKYSQLKHKLGSSHLQSKIVAIEELADDDDEPDEDHIVPYAKPDSDEDDSDDDPTLIQRNKPTVPVYIRDLIVYLRDTESYDRQKLGLSTASSLVRRKTWFGTEVSDHVEELAKLLMGIQDKFDIDNFQDMRIQGMIAVLVSKPSKMGPWFAKTFFEGDYSVAQRASILTVLSISARELGGFKDQDASLTTAQSPPLNSFPSEILPHKLHKLYSADSPSAIEALSQQLSNSMIQPVAASLADKATGPDILKVRTFSSRLVVEAKRKPPTINTFSAIVANGFFFPLTGRFASHLRAYGAKNVIFEPFLLNSYLKTLSLILHAAGTSTLQLSQMTNEFWDLLLSLRTLGQSDSNVGEAIMFGFLTILEMNTDQRRLAEVHGREVVETQRWVEGLFQRLGGGSKEDDKLRSLAAGVLLRIRDVMERFQALLVGDLSSL